MKKWSTQLEADRISVVAFHARFEKLKINCANATTVELETNLVEAHCIQTWVGKLKDSYASSLAEDDRKRNHLREDMRDRAG